VGLYIENIFSLPLMRKKYHIAIVPGFLYCLGGVGFIFIEVGLMVFLTYGGGGFNSMIGKAG